MSYSLRLLMPTLKRNISRWWELLRVEGFIHMRGRFCKVGRAGFSLGIRNTFCNTYSLFLYQSRVFQQERIGHSYRPILLWNLSSVGPLSNFHHRLPSLIQ